MRKGVLSLRDSLVSNKKIAFLFFKLILIVKFTVIPRFCLLILPQIFISHLNLLRKKLAISSCKSNWNWWQPWQQAKNAKMVFLTLLMNRLLVREMTPCQHYPFSKMVGRPFESNACFLTALLTLIRRILENYLPKMDVLTLMCTVCAVLGRLSIYWTVLYMYA